MAPKKYSLYTQPVHGLGDTLSAVQSGGTYFDGPPWGARTWRKGLCFDQKGGVLQIDSLLDGKELEVQHMYGWYSVRGDSLFIEFVDPNRRLMYAQVSKRSGRVVNDTTLLLADYGRKAVVHAFEEGKPTITIRRPMYARKGWYKRRVHPSRR